MPQLKSAFYTDEATFWHSAGQYILQFPVGGWIEPPAGSAHAESPESKRRLLNLFKRSGLMDSFAVNSAEPITYQDAKLIHDTAYLDELKRVSDAGGGQLSAPFRVDTPVGVKTYDIALMSAGLAYQAVKDVYQGVYQNAYSLSRPPGHHATKNQAMGFCYLNNISIAIEKAKKELGLGRVAIVDWDVHHGNGQQDIFYDRDDVLTISIHQESCYPNESIVAKGDEKSAIEACGIGKGEGYNLNIPLLPGSGEAIYLYALDNLVIPALEAYQPEMIIIASGFDANTLDPLARMMLHSEAYYKMTKRMKRLAESLCDGKLVIVHEGGYAESYVPFCGLASLEALSGKKTEVESPALDFFISQQPKATFNQFHKDLIDKWCAYFKEKTILQE